MNANAYGITVKSCVRTINTYQNVRMHSKGSSLLTWTKSEIMDERRQEAANHRNTQHSRGLDEAEKIGFNILQHRDELFRSELIAFGIVGCDCVSWGLDCLTSPAETYHCISCKPAQSLLK